MRCVKHNRRSKNGRRCLDCNVENSRKYRLQRKQKTQERQEHVDVLRLFLGLPVKK